MEYGERILEEGSEGPDVKELQIRLCGFNGKLPDGKFGTGTRTAVEQFQTDYMKITATGKVDRATYEAIDKFMDAYPIDFNGLKCDCGKCSGWGHGRYKGEYRDGKPKVEAFHKYEYPGMHRMLLFTVRALRFYSQWDLSVNSAYRCWYNNQGWRNGVQDGEVRSTTNHMGKAIDLDTDAKAKSKADRDRCNALRKLATEKCNCTIDWIAGKKALEPASIAPTWVHLDVREIGDDYMGSEFFVTDQKALDNKKPIKVDGAPVEEKPKDTEPKKQTSSETTPTLFAKFGEAFSWSKPSRAVTRVFWHCSDSDVPAHDNVETIDKWHKANDWAGIGYHLFIKKDGTVWHGRNLEHTPAAQSPHNKGTIAICVHGQAKEKFTEAQFESVRALARIIHDAYGGKITFHGHREVSTKSCPVFDYRTVLDLDATGKLGDEIKGQIPTSSGTSNNTSNNNTSNNNTSNNNTSNNNTNNGGTTSNSSNSNANTSSKDLYKQFTLYAEIQKKLKDAGFERYLKSTQTELHGLFRDVLAPHARKVLGDFPNQDKRLELIVRVVELHEGLREHMYVDTKGLLTVGIGTMIDAENSQMLYDLPFTYQGKPATKAQRDADKAACLKFFKKNSSAPLASEYASVAKCRLDVAEARKQCLATLRKFENLLLDFPNHAAQLESKKDKIPFFAWICMVDMSYGLYTIRFTKEWPTCLKHIANQNWVGAADESWVKGSSVATQALRYHLLRDAAGAQPGAGTGTIELINKNDEKPKDTPKNTTTPTGTSNLEKPTETYVNVKGDMCLPVDLGAGIQVTAESIAAAYKHTEQDHAGGYFPLGANTVWHGGVHFRVKPREVVRCIADGEIVAARLAKPADAIKAFGSRNFILVRHGLAGRALEAMARKGDVFDDNKIYHFYSLYMHLDAQPIKKDNTLLGCVRWLRAAGAKPGDVAITASVGVGGTNRAGDVKSVQKLLLNHGYNLGPAGADGDCGTNTKNAITSFQEKQVDLELLGKADGRVDAGGTTLRLLNHPPGVPVAVGDFDAALVSKLDAAEVVDVRRPVKAGEMLWVAGEHGSAGSRAWMLHFEIFSETNLFPQFTAVEDKDEDFTIDAQNLVDMVEQDFFGFNDVLTLSALQRFYKSEKGAQARRFACRFTTEWGANLDTALDRLKGRFTTFGLRERLQPYLWYTDAEVTRLKLPPRLSWHYNPIMVIEEVMFAGVKTSPPKGNPTPVYEGQGAISGVPFFCQADTKWADLKLNNQLGTQSIKQAGCAISSIAMVLAYYGRDVDPKKLDAYLDSVDGYSGNAVYWEKAFGYRSSNEGDAAKSSDRVKKLPPIKFIFSGARNGKNKADGTAYTEADLLALVDAQINRGIPTVVQVRSEHYVVIVGRNEHGGYVINDPGTKKGEGQTLTDKVTQVIQIDVMGIDPVAPAIPNYKLWTTKKLIGEMPKVKGDAQQALLSELATRHMNLHVQVLVAQESGGDQIYAEVTSSSGTAVSPMVSLDNGESGTLEIPLAALVPFDGSLTVKVYENDVGPDDLITTFEWKTPFERDIVNRSGDGARYLMTCSFEASAEQLPKAPDYSKMKSTEVAAMLADPKQVANHWAARDELGKRDVLIKVHVVNMDDNVGADEVFVELESNKRTLKTDAVSLDDGQQHVFKVKLVDLMPVSGSIRLRIYDEEMTDDNLVIEDVWDPPYERLIIGRSQRREAQKSEDAEYWVTVMFADWTPCDEDATSSSGSSSTNTAAKPLGPPYAPIKKNGAEYLSPNFSHMEFIRSSTATENKIDNSLTVEHKINAIRLCRDILEPIRAHFKQPVSISSGYRSAKLNALIKGASTTSQHMKGEAVDFVVMGYSNIDVFNWIAFTSGLDFDQLIYEHGPKGWLHVSYSKNSANRSEILIATDLHITPKDQPEDLAYGPKYKNGSYATKTTYAHHKRCQCQACKKLSSTTSSSATSTTTGKIRLAKPFLIAYGKNASDVTFTQTFGEHELALGQDATFGKERAIPTNESVGTDEESLKKVMYELLDEFADDDNSGKAKKLFEQFLSKKDKLTVYTNDDLNKDVATHPNFRAFADRTLGAPDMSGVTGDWPRIHQRLRQANWDINRVCPVDDLGPPAFNRGSKATFFTSKDFTNGLGVMINDVQYAFVYAENYIYDPQTGDYEITLRFVLYDVFGLDDGDLEEFGVSSTWHSAFDSPKGITAWWQLQHQFNYAPVIVKMEVVVSYPNTQYPKISAK